MTSKYRDSDKRADGSYAFEWLSRYFDAIYTDHYVQRRLKSNAPNVLRASKQRVNNFDELFVRLIRLWFTLLNRLDFNESLEKFTTSGNYRLNQSDEPVRLIDLSFLLAMEFNV